MLGGRVAGDIVEDASLVVTELTTNAVLYAGDAGSEVTVSVSLFDDRVRLSVRDASPSLPAVGASGAEGTSGRGLRIVEALACEWGVDPSPDGKVVWADLESGH